MQKRYLLSLYACLFIFGLYAQPQFSVIQQNTGASYLLLEAENYQYLDAPALNTSRNWNIGVCDTDSVLIANTGGTYGNNPSKQVLLEAAKAQYYLQFSETGIYYYYFRYKLNTAPGSGASTILLPTGTLDRLPDELATLSATGTDLRWAQALKNGNGNKLTITVNDTDQLYALPLVPAGADLVLDKILLHKISDQVSIDFPNLQLSTEGVPSAPSGTLQYTSFEQSPDELSILTAASQSYSIVGSDGTGSGASFVQMGTKNLWLNSDGMNPVEVTFDTIDLSCDYQDVELCFTYFAPDHNSNSIFENTDALNLYGSLNGAAETVLASLNEGALDLGTTSYRTFCTALAVPATGPAQYRFRLALLVNSADKDLFIGQFYVRADVVNTPAPTLSVDYTIVTETGVTFDLSGSTDAAFYSYSFGDGTPPTERTTDDQPAYIYAEPLVYEVCFAAFDACGNQADASCFILDLLAPLPVSWQDFALRQMDDDIMLLWSTASETDNAYFVVEHSTDGTAFAEIGHVTARGDSDTATEYDFLHRNPGPGQHLYRIRQVDYDGQFSYSPLRSLHLHGAAAPPVVLTPNPASDQLSVQDAGGTWTRLLVSDALGRTIWSQPRTQDNTIRVAHWPQGVYYLQARDDRGKLQWTERILVEH